MSFFLLNNLIYSFIFSFSSFSDLIWWFELIIKTTKETTKTQLKHKLISKNKSFIYSPLFLRLISTIPLIISKTAIIDTITIIVIWYEVICAFSHILLFCSNNNPYRQVLSVFYNGCNCVSFQPLL